MRARGERFSDAARRVARQVCETFLQQRSYGAPHCVDHYETERRIADLLERELMPAMEKGHDRNV